MAATNSTSFPLVVPQERRSSRDLAELSFGFTIIMAVLWVPERAQLLLGPIALLATLSIVLLRERGTDELGLGWRGLLTSLWIVPAAAALAIASALVARASGTLHALHNPDLGHVGGYVLWTIYQQFLLQNYFMPRLTRVLASEDAAVGGAAVLFAIAHLPNLPLTAATLVWGAVSCTLFRRYRSIYAIGVAQGILGLCFAVCIPDALHHHLRVGLGFLRYQPPPVR